MQDNGAHQKKSNITNRPRRRPLARPHTVFGLAVVAAFVLAIVMAVSPVLANGGSRATAKLAPARAIVHTGVITLTHGHEANGKPVYLVGVSRSKHRQFALDFSPATKIYSRKGRLLKGSAKARMMALEGKGIRIRGVRNGTRVIVKTARLVKVRSNPKARAALAGARKVAVIMFNFSNDNSRPFTVQEAKDAVFGTTNSSNEMFQQESYGTFSLAGLPPSTGDVFDWVTINQPNTGCSDNFNYWSDLARTAVAANNDLSQYESFVYVMPPSTPGCPALGWAYTPGPSAWLRTLEVRTITHELSHSFGLKHAALYSCLDGTTRVSLPPNGTCKFFLNTEPNDYGDTSDYMGDGSNHHLLNGLHRARLGFLPQSRVQVASGTGQFTVASLEQVPSGPDAQLLMIPVGDGSGNYFYIDYRRPNPPYDDFIDGGEFVSGVSVRVGLDYRTATNPMYGHAVNVSPNSVTWPFAFIQLEQGLWGNNQTLLRVGRVLYIPGTNRALRLDSFNGTSASVSWIDATSMPASTASIQGSQAVFGGSSANNDVSATANASSVTFVDNAGPVTAVTPCTQSSANKAVCPSSGVTKTVVNGGDGNDIIAAFGTIATELNGDGGDDQLSGGEGDDTIEGGLGNDAMSGASGTNTLSYVHRTGPLNLDVVDANGTINVTPGEIDSVTGYYSFKRIYGGQGNDIINGIQYCDAPPYECSFYGFGGDDIIIGSWGPDFIDGGTGIDTITALPGNDTLATRDGMVDYIDCGDGVDTASADAIDDNQGGLCENVNTAPDTTITSGPANGSFIATTTPQFAFVSDTAGATFECSVDGAGFAACMSPETTATLSQGSHTFSVRARDVYGADPSPDTRTFTVDTTGPTLVISSPTQAQVLTSNNVSVAFTAGADATSTTCQMDGAAAVACVSPNLYSAIADGAHSVSVRAYDAAGNSTTVVRDFTVATPVMTLTATNAAPGSGTLSLSGEGTTDWAHWGRTTATSYNHKSGVTSQIPNFELVSGGTVTRSTSGTPSVSWSGGTPTSSSSSTATRVRISGVGNGFRLRVPASNTTVKTLKLYVGVYRARGKLALSLPEGGAAQITDTSVNNTTTTTFRVYTIKFRAAQAGQTLKAEWTMDTSNGSGSYVALQAATLATAATDTTPPQTTITAGPADNSTITTSTAQFSFSSEAGATFQCQLDFGGFTPCTSPKTTATLSVGLHRFDVRAIDAAGNADQTPARRTFTKQ